MKNLVLTTFLVLSLSSLSAFAAGPKDLSNMLPTKLVKSLYDNGMWMTAFDNADAAETADVRLFWQELYNKDSTLTQVVEQIFSGNSSASFQQLPPTYPVKIEILRWLKIESPSDRWVQVEKQVLLKYFTITATLIKASQITEMAPILTQAKSDIESNRVQLKDLSPATRVQFQDISNPIHQDIGKMLTKKVEGRYLVNGLYYSGKRILAIDISRPVTETLITLAHEMVHMSDPELALARQKVEALFPYVQSQMSQILGKQVGTDALAKALVLDVFAEMGKADVVDVLSRLRDKQLETLTQTLQDASLLDKTEDPKIKEWTQALLAATLENEIRAYIFSLSVYKQLKDQMQILPPSTERQRFISQITEGNFAFAKSLSAAMNPFNRESLASRMIPENYQGADLQQLTIRANYCKSILEHHYLTQTKILLASLDKKYERLIQLLRQPNTNGSQSNLLPTWTQPGQFESPANPYVVLTAKISTAWALRFKAATQGVLGDLQDMNSSLMTLHAGILDMHDISFGEMKLLGIHAPGATADILPQEVQGNLRNDLTSVPGLLQSFFQKTQWSPTDFSSSPVIDQQTLTANLIRLRLLKSLYWLENSFPPAKENITSIKVLQLKLHEGFYDKEELSDDRVQELSGQLTQALQYSNASGVELKQMQTLFDMLASMYTIANEQNWLTVANDFSGKLNAAIGLLENMGLEMSFSKEAFKQAMAANTQALKRQMAEAYKSCTEVQDMYFVPSQQKFTLGNLQFPLTTICYQNKVYSFRQPGDYTRSATTLIKNGAPESRVFIGARPIRLSPVMELQKGLFGGSKW